MVFLHRIVDHSRALFAPGPPSDVIIDPPWSSLPMAQQPKKLRFALFTWLHLRRFRSRSEDFAGLRVSSHGFAWCPSLETEDSVGGMVFALAPMVRGPSVDGRRWRPQQSPPEFEDSPQIWWGYLASPALSRIPSYWNFWSTSIVHLLVWSRISPSAHWCWVGLLQLSHQCMHLSYSRMTFLIWEGSWCRLSCREWKKSMGTNKFLIFITIFSAIPNG